MSPRTTPPVPRRPRRQPAAPAAAQAREDVKPPGASTPTSCAPSRTTPSATSCASRRRSGCSRPPTASSAAPRGTWTSSTSSAGSRTPRSSIKVQFRNAEGTIEFSPAALHVEERVALQRADLRRRTSRFLQACVTTATPKLTIPSPSMVHYRGGRAAINEDVYPDMDDFWTDLTTAYADEVKALGDLGCTYLQFDDTSLAYLNDPKQREHIAAHRRRRRAPARDLHPPHQRGARGPPRGHGGHHPHVPRQLPLLVGGRGRLRLRRRGAVQRARRRRLLHRVRRRALGRLRAAALRAAGQVRRPRPGHTKRGELETQGRLKRRIEEAGRTSTLDQLCLSPQCGFSSTVEGNALTEESSGPSCARSSRPRRGLGLVGALNSITEGRSRWRAGRSRHRPPWRWRRVASGLPPRRTSAPAPSCGAGPTFDLPSAAITEMVAMMGRHRRRGPHARSVHDAWPQSTTRLRRTASATAGRRASRAPPWPPSAPVSRSFACSPASAARSRIATPMPRRSTSLLSGTGRAKLGDELLDVGPLDTIRVAPATARAFEAGPDGLEFLAFGAHHPGDGEPVEDPWTDR